MSRQDPGGNVGLHTALSTLTDLGLITRREGPGEIWTLEWRIKAHFHPLSKYLIPEAE